MSQWTFKNARACVQWTYIVLGRCMNPTDPLLLCFLQTVSIISCDYHNDSSKRCWMRHFFLLLFWTTMTGLVNICHCLLSSIVLSGIFIENFYYFHPLEKLCGLFIIYLHSKTRQFNLPCLDRPLAKELEMFSSNYFASVFLLFIRPVTKVDVIIKLHTMGGIILNRYWTLLGHCTSHFISLFCYQIDWKLILTQIFL